MVTAVSIAQIGALIGDPTRAVMLQALMDGRALTASELADAAGITPQTGSGHLAQLVQGGIITVTRQGRHRYHRLATPEVARVLESVMRLAADMRPLPVRTGPRDAKMRLARSCYDHIAGWLGVGLAETFMARGWVEAADDAALVTPSGLRALAERGIAFGAAGKRPLCRICLDWSERRPHLSGQLGGALFHHALAEGWVRRCDGSRTLDITPKGQSALRAQFGIGQPDGSGQAESSALRKAAEQGGKTGGRHDYLLHSLRDRPV